jgi:hypothetical protein
MHAASSSSMFQIVNDSRLQPIADEAEHRLRSVFDAVRAG